MGARWKGGGERGLPRRCAAWCLVALALLAVASSQEPKATQRSGSFQDFTKRLKSLASDEGSDTHEAEVSSGTGGTTRKGRAIGGFAEERVEGIPTTAESRVELPLR